MRGVGVAVTRTGLLHACKVVARLLQGCNKLVTMSRPIARLSQACVCVKSDITAGY